MNPEIELAQLALHGRRYAEAEDKFSRLLSGEDAPVAWLGIGLAKFGRLPSKKSTPGEVTFCFGKVTSLAPEKKDEAYLLLLSAARATLEDIAEVLPQIAIAEDAASRAFVAGLLHKGVSMLRASDGRPTLFTNLDALHDSYRGWALLDASSEMKADAGQMRSHLVGSVTRVREVVVKIVPDGFPSRRDYLAAADEMLKQLSMSQGVVSEGRGVRVANLGDYTGMYKSTDQRTVAGICGGLAHKWGWNHSLVQLLFMVGYVVSYGILFFMYIYWWMTVKKKLPTKGVPRPQKRANPESCVTRSRHTTLVEQAPSKEVPR